MSSSTAPATVGAVTIPAAPQATVTVTVLYDNTAAYPDTRSDWGFACLVEGLEKTVLFDTGANGGILLSNMRALHKRPEDIDVIVLSHDHADHTGGLVQLLAVNSDVTVYYPAAFARKTISPAKEAGASLVPVGDAVSPCTSLVVTKPLGSPGESALLIETTQGRVLVVGCAHPGVTEMVAAASELARGPIWAVLGGFHLASQSAGQVDRVIQGLKDLGVERCGPAHCTGESAIAQIRAAFGRDALDMGVGATITS